MSDHFNSVSLGDILKPGVCTRTTFSTETYSLPEFVDRLIN